MGDDAGRWHLDKRVPISIIAALFVQFLGGVWFVSKLESRIMALEMSQAEQRERDDRQDRAASEAITVIRAQLDRIDANIIQLIREGRK